MLGRVYLPAQMSRAAMCYHYGTSTREKRWFLRNQMVARHGIIQCHHGADKYTWQYVAGCVQRWAVTPLSSVFFVITQPTTHLTTYRVNGARPTYLKKSGQWNRLLDRRLGFGLGNKFAHVTPRKISISTTFCPLSLGLKQATQSSNVFDYNVLRHVI